MLASSAISRGTHDAGRCSRRRDRERQVDDDDTRRPGSKQATLRVSRSRARPRGERRSTPRPRPASASLRMRVRNAAPGNALVSCDSDTGDPGANQRLSLRRIPIPVLPLVLLVERSANTRRKVRRLDRRADPLRPRQRSCRTRKRMIAPCGALELLGDELERASLLGRPVDTHRRSRGGRTPARMDSVPARAEVPARAGAAAGRPPWPGRVCERDRSQRAKSRHQEERDEESGREPERRGGKRQDIRLPWCRPRAA